MRTERQLAEIVGLLHVLFFDEGAAHVRGSSSSRNFHERFCGKTGRAVNARTSELKLAPFPGTSSPSDCPSTLSRCCDPCILLPCAHSSVVDWLPSVSAWQLRPMLAPALMRRQRRLPVSASSLKPAASPARACA